MGVNFTGYKTGCASAPLVANYDTSSWLSMYGVLCCVSMSVSIQSYSDSYIHRKCKLDINLMKYFIIPMHDMNCCILR